MSPGFIASSGKRAMKWRTASAIEFTCPGVPVTARAIEHAGREVARLAHERREGGAQQDLRLLLDDRDEAAPHYLEVDFGQRVCGQVPAPARQAQHLAGRARPAYPQPSPIAPLQFLADILTTVDWSD